MNNLVGSLSFHGNISGQMGSNLITNVEANPTGTPTEILTSIRVGDIIYSIPSGGGGGGGTNNYNDLLNKPKINNVTLTGNKTLDELSIQSKINFPMDSSKYLDGEGNFTTPNTSSSLQIDLLLDTPFSNGQATLAHNISDYDDLVIIYGFTDPIDNASAAMNIPTSYFINNCVYNSSPSNSLKHILFNPYNNSYNRLIMGDSPNKLYLFDPHNTEIKRVYGVKY